MDSIKLSRKVDLKGVYMEEYLWRLIPSLIHTSYTSSILSCILKENFQKTQTMDLWFVFIFLSNKFLINWLQQKCKKYPHFN